jgi:hypothetical protein
MFRVARWVCNKNRPKCSPTHFLQAKKAQKQKIGTTSVNFEKLAVANNCRQGENFPNLGHPDSVDQRQLI